MIELLPNPTPEKHPLTTKINEIAEKFNLFTLERFRERYAPEKTERPKAAEGAMRNMKVDTRLPKWSNNASVDEDTTPEGTIMPHSDNFVRIKRTRGWEIIRKEEANESYAGKTDPRIPTDATGGERLE